LVKTEIVYITSNNMLYLLLTPCDTNNKQGKLYQILLEGNRRALDNHEDYNNQEATIKLTLDWMMLGKHEEQHNESTVVKPLLMVLKE
jgi:hypothetical protein